MNSLDYGLGRHIWFLTDEQRIGAMKYDFLSQPLGKYFFARPTSVSQDSELRDTNSLSQLLPHRCFRAAE